MSVDAIAALNGAPIVAPATSLPSANRTEAPDFSRWMTQEIQSLNGKIAGAEESLANLATGETANLHGVMIELENARLAFQLALQVRNKLLEGYHDLMRMQI
jgi:flagellar hook-basal body complex protein FliE